MTNKSLSRLDGVPWHLSLINGWITAPRDAVWLEDDNVFILNTFQRVIRWDTADAGRLLRSLLPHESDSAFPRRPWALLSYPHVWLWTRPQVKRRGEVMQVPRSSQWRSQLMTRGPGCWAPRTDIAAIPLTPPSISDGSMGPRQPQPALLGVFALHRNCVGGDDNEQPSQWQARGAPGLAPVW